jgi:beta-glucosidase
MILRFPPGFAWGSATAAYQIEGAVLDDGRGDSIWDTFCSRPGTILNGDTADVACDHYHRYREDVALLGYLGARFYRFSLAWPRLMPSGTGAINEAGLDFYKRLLDELDQHSIEPWITLYHWDLPQALEDRGGWPARDTALRFAEYAAAVHERLRDRVRYWTTLNEPFNSAFTAYASGEHAPGVTDPKAAVAAGHHLLLGHGLAIARMREQDADAQLGITLNFSPYVPVSSSPADRDAARRMDARQNRFFLEPILAGRYSEDNLTELAPFGLTDRIADGDLDAMSAPLDLLGVNYYRRLAVRAGVPHSAPTRFVGCDDVEIVDTGLPKSTMGWPIDPDGLHELLTRLARDYSPPPMYITENGVSCDDTLAGDGQVDDQDRIDFLAAHLRAAHRAIADGVDLRGYFVWSLLDNFEWALGYEKRFGIVHVDYDTLERTPKTSAHWFRDVVARNGIELCRRPPAAARGCGGRRGDGSPAVPGESVVPTAGNGRD